LEESIPKLTVDINRKEPPPRNLNFYCFRCKYKDRCLINIPENIFDINEV